MDAWMSWCYHYGLGGVLFLASIALALRSGALQLRRRDDRRLLLALAAGLVTWMAGHAIWIAWVGRMPLPDDARGPLLRTESVARLIASETALRE